MTNGNTIGKISVIGAGYMGGGIAQVFSGAGYPVTLADQTKDIADAAVKRVVGEAKDLESRNLTSQGTAASVEKNLTSAASIEDASKDADLVLEAVYEDIAVKKDVLSRVSNNSSQDTIIGTNTSTISVNILKDAVTHPERFMTVHFFNPAPLIPGAELVTSTVTDPAVPKLVVDALHKAGKRPAVVGDTPGMVVNRIQYAMLREAFKVVEDGVASMQDVDTLVRNSLGFRLGFFGPFSIVDQAGVDVYASCFKILEDAFGDRMSTPKVLSDAVAAGVRGTKSGHGLLGRYSDEDVSAVQEYRSNAYARMQKLQAALGDPPSAHDDEH